MKKNAIEEKSFSFAVEIVNLYKFIYTDKKEFVLAKQLLRSGTSIGANVREALNAQSKKDFLSKMNIALKEASETKYWLELLVATEYISENQFLSIRNDCTEIEKILTQIVKTTKNNLKN
ncbi:four helix bundle protein [Thermanaerosceptrum fracticalcis]|uniref:Four helix bundle protein n=1 Tax=Thermanaerosceptrum fracticalcis TaxID=1712410 RepID=A0A7G6E6T3_THEFR|nr:four helix bundle protein [Thermanaerosceptrum fracticalcis]QNB47787.1 four helix bundle protein [Thermanaerosceptrum fracticalcis]